MPSFGLGLVEGMGREGVAVHRLVMDGHEAALHEPRERGRRHPAPGQHRSRQARRHTRQERECLALTRAEARRPGVGGRQTRRVHRDPRRGIGAECGEARDAAPLERRHITGQDARRKRRGQHVAGPGHVVVGHPRGEGHERRRHEGGLVAHGEHLPQLHRRIGSDVGGDDDAGQTPRAERHVDARADDRGRRTLRPAVGQHVERRHGHGHRHDPAHGLAVRGGSPGEHRDRWGAPIARRDN